MTLSIAKVEIRSSPIKRWTRAQDSQAVLRAHARRRFRVNALNERNIRISLASSYLCGPYLSHVFRLDKHQRTVSIGAFHPTTLVVQFIFFNYFTFATGAVLIPLR